MKFPRRPESEAAEACDTWHFTADLLTPLLASTE